jgi:hypothetical protein
MKQIKITKGTRAGGKRLKKDQVAKVPGDLDESAARFLVATGQAVEAGAKDEPDDKGKAHAK